MADVPVPAALKPLPKKPLNPIKMLYSDEPEYFSGIDDLDPWWMRKQPEIPKLDPNKRYIPGTNIEVVTNKPRDKQGTVMNFETGEMWWEDGEPYEEPEYVRHEYGSGPIPPKKSQPAKEAKPSEPEPILDIKHPDYDPTKDPRSPRFGLDPNEYIQFEHRAIDPATGKFFYYNQQTGERSWHNAPVLRSEYNKLPWGSTP